MQTKEWTLMFYFASDNPLASTIVSQLKAIKDAGYHPDANVIAHFDPHQSSAPVHVFDVNHVNKFWYPDRSEVGFTSNDPFVRDLVLDRLWGENDEEIRTMIVRGIQGEEQPDRGVPKWIPPGPFDPPKPTAEMNGEQDPKEALECFLKFCRESYPARHYMLFILGHGQVVGNDNLLFDDHATKKALTLTELGEVLRSFNGDVRYDREPGQVELITLHSCSMSALEVAYELKGAANYMLASQGPTYVGNLPYKQILIRVFNDLNSGIAPDDINGLHAEIDGKQSLVERLFSPAEPVSEFIRSKLTAKTVAELETYNPGTPPDPKLLKDILEDVNRLLEFKDTDDALLTLIPRNGNAKNNGSDLSTRVDRRRFNRSLLVKAFPEISRYPRHRIETMLSKIFYYTLYNSYDFQLAGYPYDLCLTNLTKVSDTEDAINQLADSLIKALEFENPIPKQLLLLAHWDAQSFYREEYVDLYDFCFCLKNRCNEIEASLTDIPKLTESKALAELLKGLTEMVKACQDMINVLEKGSGKLVTLTAFAGAAFQYSHGHSIYFPWTKPEDQMWEKQYNDYRLNRNTRWRKFLNAYFEKTMRKTRKEELGPKGNRKCPRG